MRSRIRPAHAFVLGRAGSIRHNTLSWSSTSSGPIPDFAVRLAARFLDRSLREITPALGRRNRHSTEKARRVLGWEPRPARDAVLDCARSLIAHGAV